MLVAGKWIWIYGTNSCGRNTKSDDTSKNMVSSRHSNLLPHPNPCWWKLAIGARPNLTSLIMYWMRTIKCWILLGVPFIFGEPRVTFGRLSVLITFHGLTSAPQGSDIFESLTFLASLLLAKNVKGLPLGPSWEFCSIPLHITMDCQDRVAGDIWIC